MVNLDKVKKLIQEVENGQSKNVQRRVIKDIEELKEVLTNRNIQMQYDWTGNRYHLKKVIGIASTRPEVVSLGEISQYERLEYGTPTMIDKKEIPPVFDPEARYAILVHETDEISYRYDYQFEEKYTLYTFNDAI